jgi:hypothetical protein
MARPAKGTLSVLLAVGVILIAAASAPGDTETSGSERFDGGLRARRANAPLPAAWLP